MYVCMDELFSLYQKLNYQYFNEHIDRYTCIDEIISFYIRTNTEVPL